MSLLVPILFSSMAQINRVGSPMDFLDESLDEAPDKVILRKKLLQEKQRMKSPFLIGSIEDLNRKISKLDKKLQNYTELVCESRDTPDDDYIYTYNSRNNEKYQQNEKETKEVCKFAGIFTLKSTFVPNLSDRVKNISKISMSRQKKSNNEVPKSEANKPKFVELYQYPGYDPSETTPLPGNVSANTILQKVSDASVNLHRKPSFRPEFERLFFSEMCQAILLDIFWYLFLDQFQPNDISQTKIFDRVSKSYVKLLMHGEDPFFKDIFFKDFPRLMSQGVYAAFVFSFPDSYRQFGEKFKDKLTFLVYGWIGGIRPAPRSWMEWNMTYLEPSNIKQREEIMNRSNRKKVSSIIDFDYLDSLISTNASQYASTASLAQSTSRSSIGNSAGGPSKLHARFNKMHPKTSVARSNSPRKLDSPTSSHDFSAIDAVANAQKSPRKKESVSQKEATKPAAETLTPIREIDCEEEETDRKSYQISVHQPDKKLNRQELKSHPVGKGCDFARLVFNTEGQSPLIAHFQNQRGLNTKNGQKVLMQWVEMENLPPLDAVTYKDVIRESVKSIRKTSKNFQHMYHKNMKENRDFVKDQQNLLREHERKQSALLNNKPEVKRLSDLLILEQRKGQDSVSAGASVAVETALMSQD